ncbi:sigma-54 interaction domain-containing protein [Bacillus seohaeanensis]|uniref:HTH-type transcriptional regulatory protein TyrR n=1 Tax=Bacillus seohaeanensis TaxID=284580 RepID=A0ABW5RUS0_9BACI
MIQEKVTFTFFNSIITDINGVIQSYHLEKDEVLAHSLSNSRTIHNSFDHWNEKENNLVLATKNKSKYLLFYNEYKEDEKTFKIFVVANGTEFFDLLERVKDLDKSKDELDAIIECSYDGIYITDKYGNTLNTNSAIERITGIPKHYYIGKNTTHLIKRGILEESVTQKVMEKRGTVSVVQKNFNQKETLMTGSPIFNEDGEIEKIVTNIRDLSELNDLNSELKKAQQLNEKYKEELNLLKASTIIDSDVIIKSDKMIEIFNMVGRLSSFDTTILILGETGVGKDVLVRHLYRTSSRFKEGQLVKVNCGAIPKELLESELFGYEGGAFSGASKNGKAGMFELSHKGILFLDEVGELPFDLQVKLLRVLQEKEIMRVGGTKTKKVDVRLIAATNRDLKEMVKNGHFREDLYYRLNVVPVSIPPLRLRQDDILPLIHYYLNRYNQKYSESKILDKDLNNFFYHYEWPGNVRELSNLIERLVLTIPNTTITVSDLPEEYKKKNDMNINSTEGLSLKETVELAERTVLKSALVQYKTTYEIAEALKTSQATIVRKLQKYNLS